MSKLYSTNLALASEQLQRSERAASENPNNTAYTQHRRHNSLSGRNCSKSLTKSASITDLTQKLDNIQYDPITAADRITSTPSRTREVTHARTQLHRADQDEVDSDEFRRRRLPANSICNDVSNATKDGLLETNSSINSSSILSYDEPDHLQHRFSRAKSAAVTASTLSSSTIFNTRHNHPHHQHSSHLNSSHLNSSAVDSTFSDAGCTSGMSSAFSSPCPSTVSSPLSTPTRLSPQLQHNHHQHHNHQLSQQQHLSQTCCPQKSIAPVKNSCSSSSSSLQQHHNQHNNHLHHNHLPEHNNHHPQQHLKPSSTAGSSSLTPTIVNSGSKNLKKFDPRLGPSPYRQLLPIALCILSFATVFSILIVYMDTTGEFQFIFFNIIS